MYVGDPVLHASNSIGKDATNDAGGDDSGSDININRPGIQDILIPNPSSAISTGSCRPITARKLNGNSMCADQRRCAVCKDIASGYHYGVWSCEGCKAFFKRSIQGPCDYICPATNTCTIDKHRRKSCQACRLRTCYEVGMSTRRERRPYRRRSSVLQRVENHSDNAGINKTLQNSMSNKLGYSIDCTGCSPHTMGLDDRLMIDTALTSPIGSMPFNKHALKFADANNDGMSCISNSNFSLMKQQCDQMQSADLIQVLINLEYSPTAIGLSYLGSGYDMDTMQGVFRIFAHLFDKELVFLINWAKCIPYYTHLLIEDQIRLIESGWLEVLILNFIKHSIPFRGTKIFFAPDFVMTRDHFNAIELTDLGDGLISLIREFCSLDLSIAQFSAIKAVCFINSVSDSSSIIGTSNIGTSSYILEQIKSSLIKCLRFVCFANQSQIDASSSLTQNSQHQAVVAATGSASFIGNDGATLNGGLSSPHSTSITRFTSLCINKQEQLLLILPHIKILSTKILLRLLHMKELGLINPGDLLSEMLDAQEGLLLDGLRYMEVPNFKLPNSPKNIIHEDFHCSDGIMNSTTDLNQHINEASRQFTIDPVTSTNKIQPSDDPLFCSPDIVFECRHFEHTAQSGENGSLPKEEDEQINETTFDNATMEHESTIQCELLDPPIKIDLLGESEVSIS